MHVEVANAPAAVALVPHELVRCARLFAVFILDLDVDQLRVDAHVELGQVIVLDEGESVEVAGSGSIAEDGLAAARLAAEVVAEIFLLCFFFFFVRGGVDGDDVVVTQHGAAARVGLVGRSAGLLGRLEDVEVGVGVGVGSAIVSGVRGGASDTSASDGLGWGSELRRTMVVVGGIVDEGVLGLALVRHRVVVRG